MKLELEIKGLDGLAGAINNLAEAIANTPNATVKAVGDLAQAGGVVSTKEPKPKTLGEGEGITPAAEPTKEEEPKETPVQKEKRELCEKIIALGGTPPEKGAVAKYREALEALQTPEDATPEIEDTPAAEPTKETPKEEAPAEKPKGEGEAKVTLETARAFAGVFMRSGDVAVQKPKFASILKGCGAPNLTDATQEQLEIVVANFSDITGMTLAEALKVAAE